MKNTKTLDESSLVTMFTSPNLANWKIKVSEHTIPFFFVKYRQALHRGDYLNGETRD